MEISLPDLRVSRLKDRQSYDHDVIRDILNDAMIAHIGFIREGWPVVLPFHFGFGDLGDGRGEQMIIHGSTGGRAFLDAAASEHGVPVSVCVCLNDGLVLGRSTYEIGARFRSVVGYGYATEVPADCRQRGFEILIDHVIPGWRDEVREASDKEQAATALLRIPMDHASAKVASTNTGDEDDGENRHIWAGVVPLNVRAGTPIPSPETLDPDAIPESVRAFITRINQADYSVSQDSHSATI